MSRTTLIHRGREIPLERLAILGRHRDNAVVLNDPQASRQHAKVWRDNEGRAWVADNGSSNGTLVNGIKVVDRQELHPGDVITIGSSDVEFHRADDAAPSPGGEPSATVRTPSSSARTKVASGHAPVAAPAPAVMRLDELVGRTIAGYRIEKWLGQGALAAVFVARQLNLRREVALKVFRPEVVAVDDDFADRIAAAVKRIASLDHEGLARIHETGRSDGLVWYSMELVGGASLQQVLERNSRLPPATALLVVDRVARALKAAHAAGIFHGDVKPANVMLDRGRVKLLEIGMAGLLQEQRERADRSGVVGSPLYMSPEQVRRENPDPRTDLYSLGCTLYHLIAGEPPYPGNSPLQILEAHEKDPLPSLRAAVDGLPVEIDQVLHSLIAKNREWRYADVDELLADLVPLRRQLGEDAAEAEKAAPSGGKPTSAAVKGAAPAKPARPASQRRPAAATGDRGTATSHALRARQRQSRMLGLILTGAIAAGVLAVVAWVLAGNRGLDEDAGWSMASDRAGERIRERVAETRPPTPPEDEEPGPEGGGGSGDPDPAHGGEENAANDGAAATVLDPRLAAFDAALAEHRYAEAEVMLAELRRATDSETERRRLDTRAKRLRLEGRDWYREQAAHLADVAEPHRRLEILRALRDRVLAADRRDCEARYQSELRGLHNGLADARRRAGALLERGESDRLRELGEATAEEFADTMLAAEARRFAAMTREAARLDWQGSWGATRDATAATGEAGLALAAALLLRHEVKEGLRLLRRPDAFGGALATRRDALLRAHVLLLDFTGATDLAHLEAEIGDFRLQDGFLTGEPGEAVTIRALPELGGEEWEVAVSFRLIGGDAEALASVSLAAAGKPHLVANVDGDGLQVITEDGGEPVHAERAWPGPGDHVLRIRCHEGRTTVLLDDAIVLPARALDRWEDAHLVFSVVGFDWRLGSLQILGPR